MTENPIIYFDCTAMTGLFNFTIFASPKYTFLDIRFSDKVNQIVLFGKEIYFKWKSNN